MSLYFGTQEVCPVFGDGLDEIEDGAELEEYFCPIDIESILNDYYTDYSQKAISLIDSTDDTTMLVGAMKYFTSDGIEYSASTSSQTFFHTWDKSKDIVCSDGHKYRWIVAGSNSTSNKVSLTSFNRQIVAVVAFGTVGTYGDNQTTYLNTKGLNDCSKLKWAKFNAPFLNLEYSCFARCPSLVKIEFPSTLKTIAGYAFEKCYSLKKVDLANTELISIGYGAFSYCSSLDEVIMPETIKTIDTNAFIGSGIKRVTIPKNVTSIGTSAFYNCFQLEKMKILSPNCNFGSYIFSRCYNLRTISLADGLSLVGSSMFDGCYNLKKAFLPSSVTTINSSAFASCYSLNEIRFPAQLETIGGYAFSGCYNVASLNLPLTISSVGINAFYNCVRAKGTLDFKNMLTIIPIRAFSCMQNIEKIFLPENLIEISERAFSGANCLKELVLPTTLQKIGQYAFEDCSCLTELVLPAECVDINILAFANCSGIQNLVVYSDFNVELNLSSCKNLSPVCLEAIVMNLKDLSTETSKSLVLGSWNLPKLSTSVQAIATSKNWVLS
ncbi:MAG: leucine-rich repeat domain-containing protein [Clostridia bacterium]